jgi:large subunit ribosomal protein L21
MSKYAVIEVGSRQEKVVEGDILESMNPILLSPRKGSIVTDKKSLSQCSVDLELIDEKKLKKINIFQYKNKTGNRRRVGYRDEVKVVKVKSISNNKSGEEE